MSQPLTSSLDWTGHWSFADATPRLGRQVTLAQPKASSQGYRPKRADRSSNPGHGPKLQWQPQTLAGSAMSQPLTSSLDWTGHWSFADATPRLGRQVTLAQPKASSQGYRPKRADRSSNPGQGPKLQWHPKPWQAPPCPAPQSLDQVTGRSPTQPQTRPAGHTGPAQSQQSGVSSKACCPVGQPRSRPQASVATPNPGQSPGLQETS